MKQNNNLSFTGIPAGYRLFKQNNLRGSHVNISSKYFQSHPPVPFWFLIIFLVGGQTATSLKLT
jgi:hypothetical protein